MAGEILGTISQDRATQVAYIHRLMFEMDQVSKLIYAEEKGVEKGKREMVRDMAAFGDAPEEIAKRARLTLDQVLEIIAQADDKED